MDKIIGFLISSSEEDVSVDIFNVGLNKKCIKHEDLNLWIWGIGAIENCIVKEKYSLSFPLNDNLLDRNILLTLKVDGTIIVENDWLGSVPVFYNSKEKIISTISLFCLKDKHIDKEGLYNYCQYGYSVFEKTPFLNVRLLRYYSKLTINSSKLILDYKDDPIEDIDYSNYLSEDISIQAIQQNINFKSEGKVILPLSGGFDSRLLASLFNRKSDLKTFTYGISMDQSFSAEVIYAKEIANRLNLKWQQITLTGYHSQINTWHRLFGFSTHLHGMYHMEFYSKIKQGLKSGDSYLLSGIVGDAWAGHLNIPDISKSKDLHKLSLSHGLRLSPKYLNYSIENNSEKMAFNSFYKHLRTDGDILVLIRLKIVLLSYLMQVPEYFGIPTRTPFLNFDIVKSMIKISPERRKNRLWQKDFFKKNSLYIESENLKSRKSNYLDYKNSKNFVFEKLDVDILSEYFDKEKIIQINKRLSNNGLFYSIYDRICAYRIIKGVLRRIGFKNTYIDILHEYYVIKSIEKTLK